MNIEKILFKSTAFLCTLLFLLPSVSLAATRCYWKNPCACCEPINKFISSQIIIIENIHHTKHSDPLPGFEHHHSFFGKVRRDFRVSNEPSAVNCCSDEAGKNPESANALVHSSRYLGYAQTTVIPLNNIAAIYNEYFFHGWLSGISISEITDPAPLYLQHNSILC